MYTFDVTLLLYDKKLNINVMIRNLTIVIKKNSRYPFKFPKFHRLFFLIMSFVILCCNNIIEFQYNQVFLECLSHDKNEAYNED